MSAASQKGYVPLALRIAWIILTVVKVERVTPKLQRSPQNRLRPQAFPAAPGSPHTSTPLLRACCVGDWERFHENHPRRQASPAPLHGKSCASDRHRRLPTRLEASFRGPAACSASRVAPGRLAQWGGWGKVPCDLAVTKSSFLIRI